MAIWPASSTKRLPCGHRKSSVRLTHHSGGGFFLASLPKNSLTISGMATSRPSDVMSLASEPAVRWWRYRNAVEDDADERAHHHDGQQRRRHERPLVDLAGLVEDRSRGVRLRGEGEVEDARGLVGQGETHGEQREHASDRDAADGVLREVADHAVPAAAFYGSRRSLVDCAYESYRVSSLPPLSTAQTNGLPGLAEGRVELAVLDLRQELARLARLLESACAPWSSRRRRGSRRRV